MVNRPHPYHYREDGSEKKFELNYFMNEPRDTYLHAVEISDTNGRSSRTLIAIKEPTTTISFLYGRNVILKLRKNFILEAWTKIRDRDLALLSAYHASSLKDKVQAIIEDIDGKDVDISPLKNLLESFFELATSYDQKGVEEVESKVSTAKEEYHRCVNVFLETSNASDDVEERNEASRLPFKI
ncbi:hypothetical protein HAX54_034571 [Datura stramonium]|uniref:Uncharacterized protein n=1 Tax=Datura stramonium TaxID=4076 RepID=A0ABS8SEM5_DATST|nr:hypothetical protein [Datura stramonium]